jgi:hypothetical protein
VKNHLDGGKIDLAARKNDLDGEKNDFSAGKIQLAGCPRVPS